MKHQRKAYIYALLAILCWSTISSAFKISLRYIDYKNLLFYSSFIAVVVLFIFLVIQNKLSLLKKVTRKELLNSVLMGFLNPYLYYLVLLKAYDLLQAQEAGPLNYIWPLVLVLLSIPFLHQKISSWSIVAVLISFSGIVIISTHGELLSMKFANPFGVFLAVGSALFWATYWILNIKDKREEVSKLFLNFCFGFFFIFLTVLFRGEISLPSLKGFLGSTYLGIFEMGLTFVLWLMALKYSTTTAKVSNLIYISPFISLIFIHFLVGETILFSTFIGLIFIVTGILLQQYLKE